MSTVALTPQPLPAFRRDLIVIRRRNPAGGGAYVVQDPVHQRTFTFGEAEYFLCSRLDGTASAADVLAAYRRHFGRSVGADELDAFLRQLGDQRLLDGAPPRVPSLVEALDPLKVLPRSSVPLARGDRVLAWLARRGRWLFSRPVGWVTWVTVGLGVVALLTGVSDFLIALEALDAVTLIAGLFVTSAVMHSLRAVVQGMACAHYGGRVRGVRILLLYHVLPWITCEYEAIHRLRRGHRLRVLRVGLGAVLVLWALTTIAWRLTEAGTLWNQIWLLAAAGTGGGLVFFVANPLVELNGYHLFATWVRTPRLRERALAALGARLAGRPLPEAATPRERRWWPWYAVLSLAYSAVYLLVVFVVLGTLMSRALEGAGVLLTIAVAGGVFQRPLRLALGRLRAGRWWSMVDRHRRRRWILRGVVALVVVAVLLVPYPYETGGAFTVIPVRRVEVHCEVDGGRIVEVAVREGQAVRAGDVLGRIDPRPYERNLKATEASLEEASAKLALLRKEMALLLDPPNVEAVAALEAEVRRLETLVRDYREQLALTALRAPIDGRVTTPLIEQLVGRYLKRGDHFATIEQSETVRVEIRVPEADAPQVRVGAPVKVVAWAYPYETFYGRVSEVAPIALALTEAGQRSEKYVRVVAEIANPDRRLKTQLSGFAKIRTDNIPVWFVLTRLVTRWVAVQVWYWIP